ncbi:hypothetical protein [Taibaiella soli]|uniref:Uncharacterized protein n=1 Tax=Taibaiella soli TaxID=1649169 RepID=A0A2W2AC99_9BACT|nr:hypothetical protein [Taibaiella soli]PZF73055.1 hypothetical protein DN068_09280 [Taibaiella soli]
MKKPFLIIAGINLGITLLALFSILHDSNFNAAFGIVILLIGAFNGVVGVLLCLIGMAEKAVMKYGLAMLAISGIYLLSGFTLCSQTKISVN